jgi:DNA-binding transcriptional MerR regulator
VDESWTLSELVVQAASWLTTMPPPKNGQVRAVPDERTVRYYAAIGLLDRPTAARGRTALYGRRHLAQVIAIKRLQAADQSLADIQKMWPTLDDFTLARMTGVQIGAKSRAARGEFWKREIAPAAPAAPPAPRPSYLPPVELRVELAPNLGLVIAVPDDAPVSLTPADVRALRAAAAPLVAELAKRGLTLELT